METYAFLEKVLPEEAPWYEGRTVDLRRATRRQPIRKTSVA